MGALAPGRQGHHGDADFVVEAVVGDRAPGVDQVLDVVEGVEVPDRGDPVLLEELGVQVDDVARLRVQRHHVDPAGQRLQVGVRPGGHAEAVHHLEGALVRVEVECLVAGAATGLEVGDACIARGFNRGDEVIGEDAGSVDGLEAVPEGGDHDIDVLGHGKNLIKLALVRTPG